ncbi:MarR family transcriptional regulator [Gallaecimonas kandeliae]|uniref:MarR family winged helix-turn-helix transcriptional regulator n=1 Tax=Gallaecimonas kandeliae TaxID=3029055 RepID=UPI0026498AF1|nr:MarR family transcriptional regulator [Gallaecimonas kandeliae]WKE65087.1 MarR family transcriptional regulator [Gallaecimonas kandeliae]
MAKQHCEALKLDNQLCFALYSATLAMTKLYKPMLQALDLTYPQYLMMLVLWEQDGITATELGKKLMQDLGALSPVIKRLEAQGLIERRRSSQDERKVQLHLSEAGRALQTKAEAIPPQILCSSGLDLAAGSQLKQQLESLRQSLMDSL